MRTAVVLSVVSSEGFESKLNALLNDHEKTMELQKKISDKLDVEIQEYNARKEASGDEMKKEESHDSEEAA